MDNTFHIKQQKVYFKNRALTGIDAATFEIVYIFSHHKEFNLKAYLKDKTGIWWFEENKKSLQFLTKDTAHFNLVKNDENYAVDSNTVYHYSEAIPNSHPDSFMSFSDVNPYYAKDNNQVYCYADYVGKVEIVKDANPETFLPCGWNPYGTDKHNVFYFNEFVQMSNRSKYQDEKHTKVPKDWNKLIARPVFLNNADVHKMYPEVTGYWWCDDYKYLPKNAKHIQPSRSKRHYFTNNAVFYKGDKGEPNLLEHLTYDFTSVLNAYFCLWHCHGKKEVYYKQFKIKGADLDSFSILHHNIAKDKNHIYYGRQPVKEADVSSFKVLINSYDNDIFIAKDKNHIYQPVFARPEKFASPDELLKPIKNVDASRFEFLGRYWATDSKTIFCKLKPMFAIDTDSFQLLFSDGTNEWAKDKNNLYNANGIKTYKDINGKRFVKLNRFWGKDHKSVFSFYTERILKTADANTFEAIGFDGKAHDKNHTYSIDDTEGIVKKKKRT